MHPALIVRVATPDELELVLAAIDGERPTAVDDTASPGVRIFFGSAAARDRAARILQESRQEPGHEPGARWPCTSEDVPGDDWAERSQAALGPITVGRIVVRPPWAPVAIPPGSAAVVIQPSMGFGTGHHASTRLCLRLLQHVDVGRRSVLDLGTGSGVLALAAWRLGAAPVLALDYDTDALENARDNAVLNDAAADVRMREFDLTDAGARAQLDPRTFDVVFANLTGAMLRKYADVIAGCLANRGQLIVSGILAQEHEDVLAAFLRAGLDATEVLTEDEWVAARLSASPKSSTTR